MNASYEWLRAFVNFDLTPAELADLLTRRCATVEGIIAMRADLGDIVIARVVEAGRHPNSDHLWLTKVDAGGAELLEVVCGAPVVTEGTLYPFAPVGATLPSGLTIERRKIRGETSNGMLCSARELNLGADHAGIMALDIDAAPGTRFLDALQTGDTRLVIDVLPNRPDLLSHRGIAREIAAAQDTTVKNPPIPGASGVPPLTLGSSGRKSEGKAAGITVRVEDVDGCPRYAGAVIRGVTIGPSPDWLIERLSAAGARSINNVVDVTNYMLLGFGQPMHAFDAGKLEGDAVTIRRSVSNEPIRTLDGIDRKLKAGTVVIADDARVQAIAGVIGGSTSEITPETRDIFLEVAAFDPKRTRAASRSLSISTDASYRFERGVDAEAIPELLAYAVKMIITVAGGAVAGKGVDIYPRAQKPEAIKLRIARVSAVLGEKFSQTEIRTILRKLGFEVNVGAGAGTLAVSAPSWRKDVSEEIDLIEELARTRGYDSFSAELRPYNPSSVPDAPAFLLERKLRETLVGLGLLEVRPMPFVGDGKGATVRVSNPLAEDEPFLRAAVLDSLSSRAEYNLSHLQKSVRLFEIGVVFDQPARAASPRLPKEQMRVGVVVLGPRAPVHFTNSSPSNYDEWDARWIAEVIATTAFPASDIKLIPDESKRWDVTRDGTFIGRVERLALNAPIWAAPGFGIELDLTDAASASASPPQYRPLPNTPPVEVDLALLVPAGVTAAQIDALIRQEAGELLEDLLLFDEFRGKGMSAGSRSLAWRLTFRSPERTLKEKEVQFRAAKIVRSLEEKLGVRQRTA